MGIEAGGQRGVVDDPTFAVVDAGREWRVRITWADGTAGPTIAFASRSEAETWIARDARDWLVRLAATTQARD